MAAGGNRIAIGWTLAAVCWIFAILMYTLPTDASVGYDDDFDGIDDGCDDDPNDPRIGDTDGVCESTDAGAGACCCVFGFLSLLVVESGRSAKKKAQTQVYYIPQVRQPAPQVIHHHTTHTYAPQPAQAPIQQVVKPNPASIQQAVTSGQSGNKNWAAEGRNLELARDWEGAAKAYQKAGMYEEAGRVRASHLESKEPQVKIDIAQLGDKIQDSVVMKDGQSQNDEHQV